MTKRTISGTLLHFCILILFQDYKAITMKVQTHICIMEITKGLYSTFQVIIINLWYLQKLRNIQWPQWKNINRIFFLNMHTVLGYHNNFIIKRTFNINNYNLFSNYSVVWLQSLTYVKTEYVFKKN